MPTKNAKRSTSFIRLLWPAAAANGTPVLALRMARTPHWAFGCKPDQKGASPSQALGGAGGLWRSLWLAGLLWSTARGSPAGRVQGLQILNSLSQSTVNLIFLAGKTGRAESFFKSPDALQNLHRFLHSCTVH